MQAGIEVERGRACADRIAAAAADGNDAGGLFALERSARHDDGGVVRVSSRQDTMLATLSKLSSRQDKLAAELERLHSSSSPAPLSSSALLGGGGHDAGSANPDVRSTGPLKMLDVSRGPMGGEVG